MARIKIEHLSEDSTELSDDMLDDVIGGSLVPSNTLYTFTPMQLPSFGRGTTYNGFSGSTGFAGSTFSDRRLKTDIRAVGHSKSGMALYEYRYIWDDAPRVGVMADEAPRKAVTQTASGYSRVDYAQLGL